MNRLEKLKDEVAALYQKKNPNRDEWSDWLYGDHVLLVARYARELALRFNVDPDLSEAAGLLHDIADAVMPRFSPNHEEQSAKIAKELLTQAGYNKKEIEIVVNDALKFHGCYNGEKPKSGVGKVLATADALAHLKTDYYELAVDKFSRRQSAMEAKAWVSAKIPRDYNDKICFEEVKQETKPYYERLIGVYS